MHTKEPGLKKFVEKYNKRNQKIQMKLDKVEKKAKELKEKPVVIYTKEPLLEGKKC